MDPHRLAELRSIEYHRCIALRLKAEPDAIEQALERVRGWAARENVAGPFIAGWTRLLALPIDELTERLVSDTESMRSLRQVSPFAGLLSPRERWRIWRQVRDEVAPAP